jgi:hypothetical protein
VLRKRNGQTVGIRVNMSSGERNRHAIIVKRKDTLGQTVKQNHNRITETTRGDQELNSN